MLRRLSESAKLSKARDEKESIDDRYRYGASETFVGPFGGQGRKVLCGKLNNPLVLSPVVMAVLEVRSHVDTQSQIPQAGCNFQRVRACQKCCIRGSTYQMRVGHESVNLS